MKRTLSIFLVALLAITTVSSCKKKRNWRCKCTIQNPGASAYEKEQKEILDCKEKEATDVCDQYGKEWVTTGGSYSCTVEAE